MAHTHSGRRRSGLVMIYNMIALTALMGFCSLAVDWGRVQVGKTQLRRAADAAARYGATGISDGTAVARAIAAAKDNVVDGSPLVLQPGDVEVGNWLPGVGFTANAGPLN